MECKFCKKTFKREKAFMTHLCEKKKRWNNRNERSVRLGYSVFLRFYEYTHQIGKQKSIKDFINSPYYNAFVKFGKYCIDINVININKFTEYVIQSNKKLDYWCSDKLYTAYLEELLVKENPLDALERAIKYSIIWGNKNNAKDSHILLYGNINENCYAVNNGHISPWILYSCNSGIKFLNNLNPEQMHIIWDKINPDFWQSKFIKYKEEKDFIHRALKEAGW